MAETYATRIVPIWWPIDATIFGRHAMSSVLLLKMEQAAIFFAASAEISAAWMFRVQISRSLPFHCEVLIVNRSFQRGRYAVARWLPAVLLTCGGTMVAYAGPCYVQSYAISTSVGCTQATVIGPGGSPCPSPLYGLPVGTCSYSVIPVTIRTGVSGNQPSGRQSFVVGSDKCYQYRGCTTRLFPALPIKWSCIINLTSPVGNSRSAQHASGATCPAVD